VTRAVVEGEVIIVCDSTCEIDPALANLIDKNMYVKPDNTNNYVQFNGAELVVHPKFKLFVINNSAKIKLTQDIATRFNIINFTLKPETLEKQLLNIVFKRESEQQFKE